MLHGARTRDRSRSSLKPRRPTSSQESNQLRSYIFASSAEGGVWINTTDAPLYLHRAGRKLEEWPNLPHVSEGWDAVGKHKKHQLRPPHNLVETFKRCHNALYKVGIDSEDLAMDMVRIILAKYRDELKPWRHVRVSLYRNGTPVRHRPQQGGLPRATVVYAGPR